MNASDELNVTVHDLTMARILFVDAQSMSKDPDMCNVYTTSADDLIEMALGRIAKVLVMLDQIIGKG